VPRVPVIFTGGTIAMLPDPVTGAAVPALRGREILARTPELEGIAQVEAIDWGLVSASHLSFEQLLDLARLLRRTLARPEIEGAVMVQGTDSIEETAVGFDLLLDDPKPVVVVGAMRDAGDPGWDGGRNLRDAVRVAASSQARDQGVLVVMAGSILPADDVVKLHSRSVEAFGAPNTGSLGRVSDGGVELERRRGHRPRLSGIPAAAAEPVFLVTATMGMDGSGVRALSAADPKGLVIAASGAGNTHPDLLDACRSEMARGVPVVLVSRCMAGGVAPAYGFPGGGLDWLRSGAILGGRLNGPKARICLALALGAGLRGEALRALFEEWPAA
jgi:L-asparaginase